MKSSVSVYYRKFAENTCCGMHRVRTVGCGIKPNIVKSVVKSKSQIIDVNVVIYEFISKLCASPRR